MLRKGIYRRIERDKHNVRKMCQDPISQTGKRVLLLNHKLNPFQNRGQTNRKRDISAGANDNIRIEFFQYPTTSDQRLNQTVRKKQVARREYRTVQRSGGNGGEVIARSRDRRALHALGHAEKEDSGPRFHDPELVRDRQGREYAAAGPAAGECHTEIAGRGGPIGAFGSQATEKLDGPATTTNWTHNSC